MYISSSHSRESGVDGRWVHARAKFGSRGSAVVHTQHAAASRGARTARSATPAAVRSTFPRPCRPVKEAHDEVSEAGAAGAQAALTHRISANVVVLHGDLDFLLHGRDRIDSCRRVVLTARAELHSLLVGSATITRCHERGKRRQLRVCAVTNATQVKRPQPCGTTHGRGRGASKCATAMLAALALCARAAPPCPRAPVAVALSRSSVGQEVAISGVQRLLLLTALPTLAGLALPGGASFAACYPTLFLSAAMTPPRAVLAAKEDANALKASLLRDAAVAAAAAATLVCVEARAGLPVSSPAGASVSLSCALLGALARARSVDDAAPAAPDEFAVQRREARRLRRSWDSKMSWRVRKQAARDRTEQ